ncbi:MAG: protoporphyrinogen oxidase HemJ [Arcobacteraceae bacterium]
MSEYYYPVMAFHVIAVLSWMSMLFYLPRLFVYHAENKDKKEFVEVVKVQEFKLYKYIGAPAMWATVFSGGFMIYSNMELMIQPWMHAKLLLVVLLILYSISLDRIRRKLDCEKCQKSGKFFRAYNEIPTILAILIVTYVITKSIPVGFSIGITLFFVFIMFMILKAKPKNTDNEKIINKEEI